MTIELKEKAVKGISWNLIEKFGGNMMSFVLGIILARLLTPADYGLIGMITVFFAVASVIINGGFGEAYVQKKQVTDNDANTVFFTNLVFITSKAVDAAGEHVQDIEQVFDEFLIR